MYICIGKTVNEKRKKEENMALRDLSPKRYTYISVYLYLCYTYKRTSATVVKGLVAERAAAAYKIIIIICRPTLHIIYIQYVLLRVRRLCVVCVRVYYT